MSKKNSIDFSKLKKGVLSKMLKIPEDKNIPFSLLNSIVKADKGDVVKYQKRYIKVTELMKKRANLAISLKRMNKKKINIILMFRQLNKLNKRELIFIIINLQKYSNKHFYFKDSLIKDKSINKMIPKDKPFYWIK